MVLKNSLEDVEYICAACAKELGGTVPENHMATMHVGMCDACCTDQVISNVGDWDWIDRKQRGMRD